MLKRLVVQNLAVIDRLDVEFQPGLNILSGETGSGKSVILDALELLVGAKAAPDMIRTGESRSSVEGIFEIEGNEPLADLLDRSGIEADGEIVLRREIAHSGRARIFINHQAATLALLREIQPHLVDIHGQGDQQSLLLAGNHLALLDAFAGLKQERKVLELLYEEIICKVLEIERLAQLEASRLQQLDILGFQIDEIDRARIGEDEDRILEAERNVLANAERIKEKAAEAYSSLYEHEASVLDRLSGAIRRCEYLEEFDKRFGATLEQLQAAKIAVEEAAYFIRSYIDHIEVSPERLRFIEDRLSEIGRIKRKYGGSVAAVVEMRERLGARLEELQETRARSERLESELRRHLDLYGASAKRISRERRKKAREFEAAVEGQLPGVALEAARFFVRFFDAAAGAPGIGAVGGGLRITRTGEETAEFYFTANPGEDARPLREVASGGELSRLMLLLKQVTAPTLFPRTLVFDEIDAGIGGRAADYVGAKLKDLALCNQVLCVTHQAAMARYADVHFRVWKLTEGGRTLSRIEQLGDAERVEELARMLGGGEPTTLARRHARELMQKRT